MKNFFLAILFSGFSAMLIAQTTPSGNVWLVAVGIGVYEHDDILTRLDFTVPGAYEFTRIFEGRQLTGTKPPVLTNAKAKRNQIIQTLENTFVKNPEVTEQDMILFYFSGHGEMQGDKIGICPYDYSGDLRDLISDQDIQNILKRSRAKHKVCFIEACKTEAQDAYLINPEILENFNHQRRNISSGLVYITSTKAGKKSWGKPETGGYFTHYLLRGLEGEANANDDAYITIEELFGFVETGVTGFTKKKQIPQINTKGYDKQMPIMVLPDKLPRVQTPVYQPPVIRSEYPAGFEYLSNEMVRIEGGSFQMGDVFEEGYKDEKPVHEVNVPTFYLSRYEVTNAQFCTFLNDKGNQEEGGKEWLAIESSYCKIEKSNNNFRAESGYANHPVVAVSWYGAKAYCKWLSEQTGKDFRLPTEAEWEFAARERGKKVRYGNGKNTANKSEINFSGTGTMSVTSLAANALGLHHMSGNVWEWCEDTWHENYEGAPRGGSAWGGDDGRRVVRGGSWNFNDYYCRVAYRYWYYAFIRINDIGLRLSRY